MPVATRIFLDHAATTAVLAEARDAIVQGFNAWANPSSPHGEGRKARALLEQARTDLAEALDWRHDVIFTSGASEAVGIAADRARIGGRAHSATEHAIVPHSMGPASTSIPVNRNGLIDEAALDAILAAGPTLIAIQGVNNETGILQPLDRLAPRIRDSGSLLLADCAQSAGKSPLPDADFIALSAHKLGGPPGIGALLVRDLATLDPVGGQEKGYRRGTQDMPATLGFAAALTAKPYDLARLATLRARLDEGIRASGGIIVGEDSPRLPTIGSVALPGASSASLVVQFDLAGIAVSAGAACSSGKMKGSGVLVAMDARRDVTDSAIRVSFGPHTSEADIDAFLAEWSRIAARANAA